MRLLISVHFIFIISGCFITTKSLAQLNSADSSLYNASLNNAIAIYHQSLSPEPLLYDGIQYLSYDYQITEGSPYFQSTKLSPGSVIYNNILFENVPMMYDLVLDKVVINSPSKAFFIELNSEKVMGFSLLDHKFIRLVKDSTKGDIINTGFYDLLYNGKIMVLKRETKDVQDRVNTVVERFIHDIVKFYIKKDGKYFSVNKKKNVLELLGDKKKEIRQYMRKNKLNMRKDKTNALVKIAAYYDLITK